MNCFGLKNYYADVLPADYEQHIGVVEKTRGVKELAHFFSREFQNGDRILHVCKKTIFPLKFYVRRQMNVSSFAEEVERGSIIYFSAKESRLM